MKIKIMKPINIRNGQAYGYNQSSCRTCLLSLENQKLNHKIIKYSIMNTHNPKSILRHITLLTILLFFTVISVGWAQSQQTNDDGDLKYKPWLHELTAEQALSAEVGKNKLIFPKEGNSWLSNVE